MKSMVILVVLSLASSSIQTATFRVPFSVGTMILFESRSVCAAATPSICIPGKHADSDCQKSRKNVEQLVPSVWNMISPFEVCMDVIPADTYLEIVSS